ncbi:MAG: hypothetical protein P8188_16985 [Gemmatimonadota bacterium]
MNASSEDPRDSSQSFLDEIRRRHVVKAAVAYAAIVFVVLQLAEIVLPAFRTGVQADALIRVLVVGAVLLLPVVLAAAWVWEITPRGIRSMAELDAEAGIEARGSLAHRGAFLAITAAAVGGAGLWWWQTDEGLPGRTRPASLEPGNASFVAASIDDQGPIGSLAVLPLEDLSPSGDEESYFALGMHEALLSEVSRISSLRVVSRTSVMQYSQEGKSVPRIGADLGVDAIVEGSVLRDGDRVRITVQLIHAASDTHLWAESYERDLTDVISLQREVARAITAEIQRQVDSRLDATGVSSVEVAEAPAAMDAADPSRPVSREVQEAVMRGRVFLFDGAGEKGRPDVSGLPGADIASLDEAEVYFREALSMDSVFVPALSGLAGVLVMQGVEGGEEGRARVEAAQRIAAKALELDPDNQEAMELLEGARLALEELQGSGVDSLVHWSMPTTALGMELQHSLAQAGIREGAGTKDGVRTVGRLMLAGRMDEAVDVAQDFVDAGARDPFLLEALEQGYRVLGDLEDVPPVVALRDGADEARAVQRILDDEGAPGYWRWKAGWIEAARAAGRPVSRTVAATAAMQAGDVGAALEALGQASALRDPLLPLVRHDPTWDPVRATKDFRVAVTAGRRGDTPPPPSPPGS